MILLDCSANDQQTTLWQDSRKLKDNINQDFRKSRLSTEDLAPLRARTARNATNLVNQLLESTFTSPDPRINLRQWNENAEEHETRTGERVSDGIRRAVYMNELAPQDMRQHWMLNQSRSSTAEEVAQEIEDYWDATEEFFE